MANLILILNNQLFSPDLIKKNYKEKTSPIIFLKEDVELLTYHKFHKHRTILYLSALRHYKNELEEKKLTVDYYPIQFKADKKSESIEATLLSSIKKNKIKKVFLYEIEDKFIEKRVLVALESQKIDFEVWPSPMFLTSREEFKNYLKKSKKPFMKVFYEQQRKRLQILVDKNNDPEGGRWSFDDENRLSLPDRIKPSEIEMLKPSALTNEVQKIVDKNLSDSPGISENFWLAVDRKSAKKWLQKFLTERFANFGPYEDAIPQHSDFLFHSVLTPYLNTGLLTPQDVITETLKFAKDNKINIASTEGFIRQIIGWREFIRGIYQNYSDVQETSNFFKHKKNLTKHWYDGTTGIAPLDFAIRKTVKYGYAHHIERLMVIGSLMLLLEIEPKTAHNWFMEMFVDSSDWVMGPNVYGMTLFSDGGIFATKPYFCGSNYYRKMGGYKASESWCDGVDGLYWSFIEKNKSFFLKNPRMSMMARTVEKMDPVKKEKIYKAANILRKKLTS